MTGFLSHLRVVEGSAFVAAPLAGLTLAQAGAEVIRFDLPGGGLDYRRMPRDPQTGSSFFWAGLNKGKKSVAIDFRKPEGAELIQALATAPGEEGGLLLTNFAGLPWLSYETLSRRRSDMVALEIVGNFDGGNEVDYTVNAALGLPCVTGPGGPAVPVNHVLPAWDLTCGLQAAFALLSAYVDRLRTGKGRHMTLALSDMALAVVSHLGMLGEAEKGLVRRASGNDLFGGFGRDFATVDGRRIMIVGLTQKQWKALQKATGLEADIATLAAALGTNLDDEECRYRHRDAIAELVGPWCMRRSLAEIAGIFDAAGVCWGPYQTFRQLLEEDRRASDANPLWSSVEHPGLGLLRTAHSPVSIEGEGHVAAGRAPRLGEHTEEVLSSVLNLPDYAVADLLDRGVVSLPQREDGR